MKAIFALILDCAGTLRSNSYRITCQIRGKPNSAMSKLITELSRRIYSFGQCGETGRQAPQDNEDDGTARTSFERGVNIKERQSVCTLA
jgi:hypothetical protein